MFHKHAANTFLRNKGPRLVTSGETVRSSSLPQLIGIASRRCSAFFAEAAVLVLVFGILDFFFQRGHISLLWAAGAVGLSVALLAASVATDFTAGRWLGAQP